MHEHTEREILEVLLGQSRILCRILETLEDRFYRVLGGVMTQLGDTNMALLPIAPGNSPQFGVKPLPDGVTTFSAQTVWTSDDTVNAPVTINATDPTGLTATVNIPATAQVNKNFTLTWTYTNKDATTATASVTFTIVPLVVDVTGGVLTQIV